MQPLQKSFESYAQLVAAFKAQGCTTLLVKRLARNQDNEKNQIFMSSRDDASAAVMQLFPGTLEYSSTSSSERKQGSKPGEPTFQQSLRDFAWLWPSGAFPAPGTKLIDYFQYPEVRMSGFIRGCKQPPDALRRKRMDLYGTRVLVLGIVGDSVFGAVVTEHDGAIVREVLAQPVSQTLGSLSLVVLDATATSLNRQALLAELSRIRAGGPYPGMRLPTVGPAVAFNGTQAAGYTLEALMGIRSNSDGAPDKFGFEVKAFTAATRVRVTLTTVEPDFGLRHDDVAAFIAEYGRDSKKTGKRHFTGPFKVGNANKATARTGLELAVRHWDVAAGKPDGSGAPAVVLVNKGTGDIAAGWTIASFGAKWAKKHAGAVYVTAVRVPPTDTRNYTYPGPVYLATGTSIVQLLNEIGAGRVMLDPGDSTADGVKVHRRTPWRFESRSTQLNEALGRLYERVEVDPA